MTKSVRIENADCSSHKVRIIVQQRNPEGQWVDTPEVVKLDIPTSMKEMTIWDGKRLIVEEYTN